LIAKDFRTFDPKILNQNTRGIIFLFTDTLLARKDNDIELPELCEVYQFLDFMLGYISFYLKDFPSLLNAVKFHYKDIVNPFPKV